MYCIFYMFVHLGIGYSEGTKDNLFCIFSNSSGNDQFSISKQAAFLLVIVNISLVLILFNFVQGKYQKSFETDILKLRADELNFTLCMFVKEVRNSSSKSVICNNTGIGRRHLSNLIFTSNSFACSWQVNFSSKWICLHSEIIMFHVNWTILNHNFCFIFRNVWLPLKYCTFFLKGVTGYVRQLN